jgi:hypothetical protein
MKQWAEEEEKYRTRNEDSRTMSRPTTKERNKRRHIDRMTFFILKSSRRGNTQRWWLATVNIY